jgi:hypothetical protein
MYKFCMEVCKVTLYVIMRAGNIEGYYGMGAYYKTALTAVFTDATL